jgi:protein O-mannosyl-transferase
MFSKGTSSTADELHALARLTRRRDFLAGLFLVALVVAAYARVWSAGFIWDDEAHLTQNPCVVGPLGLKQIWTSARAIYYPLVLTTFWSLHKLVGLNPFPYHILNVLIHAGSAILLWRVLRLLAIPGAWLGAALWALHPVMVQSVAWVTELKNTQSCLFYLLSILCFLKFDASPQGSRWWWLFGLALPFFVLAITSKPSTVMLPAVLALCIWWRRGRLRWRDIIVLIPFALISLVAGVWTIWEQKFHAHAIGPEWALSWAERLIIAGRAIWFYLGKLVWPHPLIFIYPRWEINTAHVTTYLPLFGAVIALTVLWLIRRKWSRSIFFAAAYFVILLFPILGFFSVYFFRYAFVSDHFQYLASMGPLALAGARLASVVQQFGAKQFRFGFATDPIQFDDGTGARKRRSFVGAAVIGLILVVLGVLTWQQTAIYHNVVTLYQATLANNPGCWMAHYNLGIALQGQGETDEAINHYRQAIALRPNYLEAHYNLGRLLVEKGDVDDAIAHYETALAINPGDAEVHNNLGATLFESGRVDEAIVHYQKALEIQPDYAAASCNLANALLAKGDTDGAITYYLAGLALSPNQAETQYNLASALLRKGRTAEAIVHYEKTLELRPDNADAHANLGSALLAQGRVRDAIAHYRDALRIAPEHVAAQTNLAWLLATSSDPSLRDGPQAVALAEAADRLSAGRRAIILRILAAAYAETGRFAEAKETAQRALQLADDEHNTVLLDAVRKEIALYESGLPFHKQTR